MYVHYPDRKQQAVAIPTGLHCTTYRVEVGALVHAGNINSSTADPDAHVVFLTDTGSVLAAVTTNRLLR